MDIISVGKEESFSNQKNKLEFFRDILVETGFEMDPIIIDESAPIEPTDTSGSRGIREIDSTPFQCWGHYPGLRKVIGIAVIMDSSGNSRAYVAAGSGDMWEGIFDEDDLIEFISNSFRL